LGVGSSREVPLNLGFMQAMGMSEKPLWRKFLTVKLTCFFTKGWEAKTSVSLVIYQAKIKGVGQEVGIYIFWVTTDLMSLQEIDTFSLFFSKFYLFFL
jgi:hypothetical protein